MPRQSTTTVTAPPAARPVYQEGVPQVTATPGRATVGSTVRISGAGFTDSMWGPDRTMWLVGMSEGSCSLYAEAEGARVTVSRDGLLEGEFVVPAGGGCRQSTPQQGAEVAPGDYRIAYGCTPCFIGELTVFEEALTASSRLRADGIGPLRIGMTLEEARLAAGTPLDTVHLQGCVELVPTDPPLGIGLWSHDGHTLDVISGVRPSLATRAGIRVGSPVETVEAAYPTAVRNVDEFTTYLVVRAGNGLALSFEILGSRVRGLFAGEIERIEYGPHCP